MFTSTIILKGSLVVEGVSFSWWVRDGWEPMLTVSNHNHGTATRPLGTAEPVVQARAIAKSMIGRTHSRTEPSAD